jgi:hypothetical protein
MAKAPPKVPPVPTCGSSPQVEVPPHTISIVDNLHASEVYATEVTGYSVSHGHVTLTLASLRASWDEVGHPNKRVVIGRVVLPVRTAHTLVSEIYAWFCQSSCQPSHL